MSEVANCGSCHQDKPVEDFYKRKDGKPRTYCKVCWSKQVRDYQDDNPDKVKKWRKAGVAGCKEKRRVACVKWREKMLAQNPNYSSDRALLTNLTKCSKYYYVNVNISFSEDGRKSSISYELLTLGAEHPSRVSKPTVMFLNDEDILTPLNVGSTLHVIDKD